MNGAGPRGAESRMLTTRPPRRLANALIRELATWLEPPDGRRAEVLDRWGPTEWAALPRMITIQGLAPHLARTLPGAPLAASLPAELVAWIVRQDAMNSRRLARMHNELAAILGLAATAGIEVMPLKGALLTTIDGPDPVRRPMADLDLLVHPGDRSAMGSLLGGLGYRHAPEANPRPTHDVFLGPEGARVVSVLDEHPDNPRRVEVHVEVKRHLWGWADDDDLTALLWADARPGRIHGKPAVIPRPDAVFAHLAIHASSDLLVGRGRLVQWLDLAAIAPVAGDLAELPHARLAYPSLRLASRAMPIATAGLDLDGLAGRIPPRLARWARSVPLDGRCGLTTGRLPDAPSGAGARWERWRPNRWRLAVAYGETPLPLAVARHGLTVVGRARHRG